MDDLHGKIRELNVEMKNYKEQFTDFVEAASHDLHAPMRKLSVLIERLVSKYEPQFDDGATEYINRIQTCIREMRSLIDGLAELAKANMESLEFEACDLNQLVNHELATINDEIEERRMLVDLGSLPVVNGVPLQYKRLFKNLIENAIKFSRKDAPAELKVSGETINDQERKSLGLEPAKKYYRIEISDNGIGFNQHHAEKIFEPFVRLHSRSEYEGSGIGLSICKKIVMNHKGRIFAEGNENGGSRFTLILPESP